MTVSRGEIYSISFCFLGCVLLVPSCISLIHPVIFKGFAISGLITACVCLTIAAALDLYAAYVLFRSAVGTRLVDTARRTRNTKCYQIFGAGFFLIASLMYLPFLASKSVLGTTITDLGTWVFRFGSFAYLGSNYRCGYDLIKTVQKRGYWLNRDVINFIAICVFILGSLFYIFGGIVEQMKIGDPLLMPELWVIGSISFAIGSFIYFKATIARVAHTKKATG